LTQKEIERAKTGGVVKQINRILINALGADNQHLFEADVDIEPRHEAFWFVGGIEPAIRIKRLIAGHKSLKEYANDPQDRSFRYYSEPLLALRHQHPLLPFEDIDFDSMTEKNNKIPTIMLDPRKYGFIADHVHGASVPGFWPGNVREYGMTSFHDRSSMSVRNPDYGGVDNAEALHAQGILSSFGWLHSQAFYQGFTTFNDLTYPLSTQTVITDGQVWSFYKYQLNTTLTHTLAAENSFKYNKCWGTKEMKLYDSIENGKLQGVNDEVLKNLLTFYLNQPVPREHAMKPLLGEKVKKVADLENLEQREWLEKIYKHLVSNRPRHHEVPEIYNWERIYKLRFNTRPLDRKLRFFELGINPYRRELDEHKPEYIPRKFRARGIHDKLRYKSVYYPGAHNHYIPREQSWKSYGAPKNEFAKLMDMRRKSYK
jgi:small subunit ribosomal protein S30